MRIEAYNKVQQLYNNKNVSKLKKEKTHSFSDQLQISSLGKDIQTAKQPGCQGRCHGFYKRTHGCRNLPCRQWQLCGKTF